MVRIENLRVTYNSSARPVTALDGVSLSLEEGGTCAVIGPSGCGKSTLLLVLAGLLRDGQAVEIRGGVVCPEPKDISLMLQDYGLLPWKNVWKNVSLGLEIRGVEPHRRKEAVQATLNELGLWELRSRYPSQLSGGQKQRVALARSLVLQPRLYLMDEPFSSLDAFTREEMQNTLLRIWCQRRMSVILVTHSIEEAVFLGQKILILSPAPAKVLYVLDNYEMGDVMFRHRRKFFERCSQVRGLFERGLAGEPKQFAGPV